MANPSASDADGVERSRTSGGGTPARPAKFPQQVLAEVRKVVPPTRREMVTYTIIVLVFVAVMMAFVYGLDTIFSWLMGAVFGR